MIARALGFRYFERTKRSFELRLSWADISGGWGLAFGLCLFGNDDDRTGHYSLHVRLGWPNAFVRLPFRARHPKDGMLDQWGFSVLDDAVHLNWGDQTRIVHLPWSWDWHRSSYLMRDGTWLHDRKGERRSYAAIREERDAGQWSETHPYRYTLRSGQVQERTATIGVMEQERRQRWLRWLPWAARVTRSIDVTFSDEVGERSGSWKGGVIGCGHNMRKGETPEQCLRRMEVERKF